MDSDAVENSTLFVDEKFEFLENFDDVDTISNTDDEYDEFSTSSSSSKYEYLKFKMVLNLLLVKCLNLWIKTSKCTRNMQLSLDLMLGYLVSSRTNCKIYVVCNREGIPEPIQTNTLDSVKKKVRMTSIHRTGCGAGVKFKVCGDGKSFILYDFKEKHNHFLFYEDSKHMLKSKKKA
ncbi:hypothetical protein OSB04_022539 [Centaurea solstitialis]|uniref:FAR1 domain-containing protein n=1 Tax=Centaurea solstitialis TaxID=347529 RepID=A0AA38WIU0_9ASTR|nr:hypothetical protein OSB04_022539 [Centaurea solstitialis]